MKKNKNKNAQKCVKNDKNNLRKRPEGARKYVGSDVREGLVFPGSSCRTS